MKNLQSREQELKNVWRYLGSGSGWETMFYRPNLAIHTTRVNWITREITAFLETIDPSIFDRWLANELAIFHDDSEILTWDFLSMEKEKMSLEEKQKHEENCLRAIDALAKSYEDVSRYDYKKLLLLDHYKQWVEYAIVNYADKLDAHMEIYHELLAGNPITVKKLSQWNVDLYPYEYTRNKIVSLLGKLSNIFWKELSGTHPLLMTSQIMDHLEIFTGSKLHTSESIQEKSWYTLYDSWKELHFKYWNDWQKEYLYVQKEFT